MHTTKVDLDSVKKARNCISRIFVIFEEILGKESRTVYLDNLSSLRQNIASLDDYIQSKSS